MNVPLLTAALLGCCTAGCFASVLGTLSGTPAGQDVVSYNTWQATSFHIAADAGSYRVREVRLHLAQVVPNANLLLRITGSTSGKPDNRDVRAVLRIPAMLPAAAGVTVFTAASVPDPLLLPGQTYWLTLGVSALDDEQPLPAGLFRWSYATTSTADTPSAKGWSVGLSTAASGTAGSEWVVSTNTPYLFSISARPPVYAPPSAPAIAWQSGAAVITARGTPGVEYSIEASSSLTDWTAAGNAFADATGIIRFTDTVNLPSRFYRFQ
jgi:hypothetical protein